MSQDFEAALDGVDGDRRSFLKKMAITTAFAAPVVSSFTMTGIKAVYAQTPSVSSQVSPSNATSPTTTTAPPSTTTTVISNTNTTIPR
ncbi:MAG TPA: hypothetical protein VFZ17_10795 [Acidimicrobiia bacterium]|nr:hypothetical protein [Acidimicrobiia bacterium]